jgi:alpha-D-ribose 1-methylphosphonate 5-triphosphate diphosphatase PhnM
MLTEVHGDVLKKHLLGRPRIRWDANIKMERRVTDYEGG